MTLLVDRFPLQSLASVTLRKRNGNLFLSKISFLLSIVQIKKHNDLCLIRLDFTFQQLKIQVTNSRVLKREFTQSTTMFWNTCIFLKRMYRGNTFMLGQNCHNYPQSKKNCSKIKEDELLCASKVLKKHLLIATMA